MNLSNRVRRLENKEDELVIYWADGDSSRCHYVWLRDNDANGALAGVSPYDHSYTLAATRPESVSMRENGDIEIAWPDPRPVSQFSQDWLRTHTKRGHQDAAERTLWQAGTFADRAALPTAAYRDFFTDDRLLRRWLQGFVQYGFGVLHGAPITSGWCTRVVERFGRVHETHNGRFYDQKAIINPHTLPTNGKPTPLHTDYPFGDPTPTLRLMHCLSADIVGGDVLLADGFQIADTLHTKHPAQFELLTHMPITFRYADDAHDLSATHPVLTLDARGSVTAVRYHNAVTAPFLFPPEQIAPYYEAYRHFARLANDPKHQVRLRLHAGDLVLMDNTRVLHGRSGFGSVGNRQMQVCYAHRDSLLSTLRVLNR